jgi:hypothetical protein
MPLARTDLGISEYVAGSFDVVGSSPRDLWAIGGTFVRFPDGSRSPGQLPVVTNDVPAILHWDGRTWAVIPPAPFPG